jgi:hypothetical protein
MSWIDRFSGFTDCKTPIPWFWHHLMEVPVNQVLIARILEYMIVTMNDVLKRVAAILGLSNFVPLPVLDIRSAKDAQYVPLSDGAVQSHLKSVP